MTPLESFLLGAAFATCLIVGAQLLAVAILWKFLLAAARWVGREWKKVAVGP
jgi:hypothetical protein